MVSYLDPAGVDVIAPNFKRRLSGVTATIVRLVPLQAREIAIAAAGPVLPGHVPQIRLLALVTMPRRGPSGTRVWHARRNTEMLGGLALKYLLGKKLRLLFTSASQRRHTGLTKWLIRRMDAIVATSRKTAQYLERDAQVIRHGIDTDTFHPAPDRAALKAELGLPAGPLVGCFGRIRAQKGTDVFIEAMIEVLRNRPDAGGVILGRATEKHQGFERELRDKVAAAGLAGRLRFCGEVPVHEIARWYQALDLFVAPQRWEGFGLTPLEAMACGVPVVATRVGAFEELIAEGETGHLIAPGDAEGMARAIAGLLDDPAALARQSAAARRHVEQNFRIEGEAAALTAIYRDLLEARP
ncbi:glycosyl transferase family 1 [Maritimibacter sp. 55A14]|uniref:glycosyltransferase family 4 protein n=1 Tax=Maritimibacter sp. 55A14 TaxID=2174844 RepID=UPI000D61E993|nr:glycosyltransferase family 4 protein [Maritimibacter sp. 55A14]PWE32222.1 glycosyl transferase family 1 [Maritimibacter sp. 55A14]